MLSSVKSSVYYLQLREMYHDGVGVYLNHRNALATILKTDPIHTQPTLNSQAECEVHTLTYYRDWMMALWCLKSFYRLSQVDWPLYVHQGAAMTRAQIRTFRQHFPNCRFISVEESDREVLSMLQKRKLPNSFYARQKSPFFRKVFDIAHFGNSRRILFLDSDMVFVRRPEYLLSTISDAELITSQKDIESCYSLPEPELEQLTGVKPIERLNTGILSIPRSAYEWEKMERLILPRTVDHRPGLAEQTLYALYFRTLSQFEMLGDPYLVYSAAQVPDEELICLHFPGFKKPMLYSIGLPMCQKMVFPELAGEPRLRSLSK